MSNNLFSVSIELKKKSLTVDSLHDVLNWLVKNKVKIYPSWLIRVDNKFVRCESSCDEYFEKFLEHVFSVNQRFNNLPVSIETEFGGVTAYPLSTGDKISISFSRRSFDPEEQIPQGVLLKDIYLQADNLIRFTKFIWEYFGINSVSAVGMWEMDMISSRRNSVGNDYREETSDLLDTTGCFWLHIVRDGKWFPSKYANGVPFIGEKPDYKYGWHINQKIKGGTLLVQSRLPWVCVNNNPGETSWRKLEEQWSKLEKESAVKK